MRKIKIVVLHGIGGHPGIHWQEWLAGHMQAKGFETRLLALPNSDEPNRSEWLDFVASSVADVAPRDLILVGHSLGVATALDYIQRSPAQVRGLVSVAGFARDYGAELNSSFMSAARIDFDEVKANLATAEVLYGDDDPWVPQPELAHLASELKVEPRVFEAGGHLNSDSGYSQFPKLAEVVTAMTA